MKQDGWGYIPQESDCQENKIMETPQITIKNGEIISSACKRRPLSYYTWDQF